MLSPEELVKLKEASLLGLLFDENEIQYVVEKSVVECHAAGDVFIQEGEKCEFAYIPIAGAVELFSEVNGESILNGHVQVWRSINTYAILRKSNYQYSARFAKDGSVLRVPCSLIHEKMAARPDLLKYLVLMTENHEVRNIAKELTSVGCSNAFKVAFISKLDVKEFSSQDWVFDPGEVPVQTFYVYEGQLVSQSANKEKVGILQMQVPGRTWIAWSHVHQNTPMKNVVKSISSSKAFALSSLAMIEIEKNFPEDFTSFHESIVSGAFGKEEEDEVDEDIDIDEMIRQNPVTKRRFWEPYPWIQQNDEMDCAPACMAMISEYYNRKIPIQFWRSLMSTSKEGTSLFDLALTAERNGFNASALEAEDLTQLDHGFFPAIALRQYHYLVIYKVSSKHVTVGDPGIGIRKIPLKEFYEGYENALLFLKPNEQFFSMEVPKGQYGHYMGLFKGLEREMLLTFAVSIMMVLLGLMGPIVSQIYMDDVLVNRDENLLKVILMLGLGLTALNGFLSWARVYYSNYLATKFEYNLRSVFMKKMLSLQFKFFADRHTGDFTRRLDEISKLKSFMLDSLEDLIISSLSLIIYSTALMFYSPMIAVIFAVAIPFFFLISWLASKKLISIYQIVFKESAELGSNITDVIKGISTIKSLNGELSSRWKYEEKLINLLKASRHFSLTSSSIGVIAGFYTSFVNFAIMGLSAYLAIKGNLTPGQVVATTMISGNILGPLMSIADKVGDFQEMRAVMGRLNDILLSPSEGSLHKGRTRKDTLRGEIEFRDVWFRYGGEGSDWTLKGITFKIEAGQNVAFVGPSGSGKSTIACLISRLYEPVKGQIFIDGKNYLDYDIDWLRSQLGILNQESHLFHGTITENISANDPNVDMDKIFQSAEKAAAADFINKKPNDFMYIISAGGYGLSGGEKQRISLARTFYRNPKILILDEATSALDGISERKLLGNLKENSGNITTVNIAHRYSTVKHSDYALVLYEGRVVGFGTHEDLASENEIYQSLFEGEESELKDLVHGEANKVIAFPKGGEVA